MEASSSYLRYIAALNVLIQQYYVHGQGVVMLSPQGIAHVCKEDQLELTCVATMNRVLVDWIIAIPGNATNIRRSVSTSSISTEIQINSTRFIFSRTSDLNAAPLVSTLLISSVGDGLNGTEVNCAVGVTTLSTVVNIITNKHLTLDSQLMEHFGSDITLEWHQNDFFYSYYINITPDIAIQINESSSIHLDLKVPYNTFYNVSILATAPCGQNNVTNFTELFYSHVNNCGNPADKFEKTVTIIGQNVFPATEGTNVTFSCPPGSMLVGSNTAVCTANGEWEPDPRDVQCTATVKNFKLNQTGKIIIASVTISAITATIFLITGFLCGHCCQKAKQKQHNIIIREMIPLQHNRSEVVQQSNDRELDLQENVSYASVH